MKTILVRPLYENCKAIFPNAGRALRFWSVALGTFWHESFFKNGPARPRLRLFSVVHIKQYLKSKVCLLKNKHFKPLNAI